MPKWLKNPYVLAGGAGLVIFLVVIGSRGGGGNSAVASQAAADAANVQLAGLATGQNIEQIHANTAIALTDTGAAAQQYGEALSFIGHLNDNATALAGQRDNINGTLSLNQSNNALTEKLGIPFATLESSTAISLAEIQANTAQAINANNNATAQRIADQHNDLLFNQSLLGTGTTLLSGSPTGTAGLIQSFGGGGGIGSAAGGLAALFA